MSLPPTTAYNQFDQQLAVCATLLEQHFAMYQPSTETAPRASQSPHSATVSSPTSASSYNSPSPHTPTLSPSLSTAATLPRVSPSSTTTTTGSGRAVGIGPSRPHAASPPLPHPSIGSTAFPLLPRLEDMDELPHCSDELHSLTAILNNPTHPQAELPPLPLNPPPLPWSDKELSLHALSADLGSLHAQLQKFEANHGSGTFITLSEDDPTAEERRAAEQLRVCLTAVPARFFRDEVDCIEEAFAFIRDGGDEAGLLLEESRRMNGRTDSKPSSPVPSLPTSPAAARGASLYDPKTLMYTRGPPVQQPAAIVKAASAPVATSSTAPSTPAPYPPPPPMSTAASPVPAPARSFLSYIASAFSSTPVSAFQVPTPSSASNFLSSRRFASLSLSPDEEHRAAQLNASLSSYLDTLELTLTSQIQLRSASFFSSLFTINALNSDITATVAHIAAIRQHIDTTQHKLTSSGLTLLRKLIRRQRSAEVMTIVDRLLVLRRGVSRCRQLLDAGEYASVLVLMHKLRLNMWDDRMKAVKLMEGMDGELAKVREDMKQTLITAFIRLVLESRLDDDECDIDDEKERTAMESAAAAGEERKSDGDRAETEASKSKAERVVDRELREEEQENLFLLSQCLYHLDATAAAMERYSEQLLATIQARVRRYLRKAAGLSEEEVDGGDRVQLHVIVHGSQSSSPTISIASSVASSPASHSTNPFDDDSTELAPAVSTPLAMPSPTAPSAAAASPVKERLFSQALSAILPTARVAHASPVVSPRFPTAQSATAPAAEAATASLNPFASAVASPAAPAIAPSPPSPSELDSALTPYLSGLSPADYCDFLRGLFRLVLDGLHRVLNVRSVVVAAVVSIPTQLFLTARDITPQYTDDSPPPALSETSAAITVALSSLLTSCTDWSHKECARILLVRPAEQQLPALSSLLSVLTSFVSESESLTHSPISAVRSCMSSLSSSYLNAFHSFHVSSLNAALGKEQWSRVEVPREFQAMVDSKYAKKVATIHDAQPYAAAASSPSPPPTVAAPSPSSAEASAAAPSPTSAPNGHHRSESVFAARVFFVESVAVDGSSQFDKYPVVGSVLALLHSVSLYLDVASQLPTCAADVSERLHVLLSTFSSRVYALILGAGAQKSAGLTTITTTHLALCAQCIGFVLTQLPIISGLLPAPVSAPPASSTSLPRRRRYRWLR